MKILNFKINFLDKIKNKIFPFYKKKEVKELFDIFEKNQEKKVAMFVGGCIRNYLNNEEVDDIDIATVFTPEEIKKMFEDTKIKVLETGIEHGSVTLINGKSKFEITTLRKDISTDGRHAEILFTDDWQEDSNRRDFTINAIYMDRRGNIFDPQSGVKNLKDNIVKFIGDPGQRIEEDYLRIIRFIRFVLQYSSTIENSTLKAIKINLNGIKNISKERILNELFKIVGLSNFDNIVNNENLKKIFSMIFPEIKYLERLVKKKILTNNNALSREILLAIILIDNTNNYEYFCHKYKVSNTIKDKLNYLHKELLNYQNDNDYFEKNLKKNVYYHGKRMMRELNIIAFFIFKSIGFKAYCIISENIEKTTIPKFPYDGNFLLKKNLIEGKQIGIALKELKSLWVEHNYELSEKQVLKIINKLKTEN
ncbi:hypothetical protein N9S62_00890 [Pelagibacteraceae bacterium]|nr:hypothetical protein [Pelagibacteraceae bacterium]